MSGIDEGKVWAIVRDAMMRGARIGDAKDGHERFHARMDAAASEYAKKITTLARSGAPQGSDASIERVARAIANAVARGTNDPTSQFDAMNIAGKRQAIEVANIAIRAMGAEDARSDAGRDGARLDDHATIQRMCDAYYENAPMPLRSRWAKGSLFHEENKPSLERLMRAVLAAATPPRATGEPG